MASTVRHKKLKPVKSYSHKQNDLQHPLINDDSTAYSSHLLNDVSGRMNELAEQTPQIHHAKKVQQLNNTCMLHTYQRNIDEPMY